MMLTLNILNPPAEKATAKIKVYMAYSGGGIFLSGPHTLSIERSQRVEARAITLTQKTGQLPNVWMISVVLLHTLG